MNEKISATDFENTSCDKYDYLMAAFCGGIAGVIDILFVGAPGKSLLGKFSDDAADEIVKKFASLSGWTPRAGQENNIASAIGFLERNFSVNYDQRHSGDVDNLFSMSAKNHHFKSLSHSPDPIGLFFSILDQFTNTSSFISDGEIIRIDTSDKESPMKGGNLITKIFSGFCNWLGHIMSDFAGSSGARGGEGRGAGVPVPFMNLFQFCNFGSFQVGDDRQDFATVMVRVFQNGYDARFAGAMAIPVLLEELMIRALWSLRRHFDKGYAWKDCIPSTKHSDLRIMLIVGNSVLCFCDIADATVKSGFGTNMVVFFLHLNFVAWIRLIILIFKELIIRFGPAVKSALKKFLEELKSFFSTESERRNVQEFYERTQKFNLEMAELYKKFVLEVEKEYLELHKEIEGAFSAKNLPSTAVNHSVRLAEKCKVDNSKIIRSFDELDDFFK